MSLAKKRFAQLLTEGIHRIRLRENKTVQMVQDELGYHLGREGGSALEYWRKGHLPAKLEEVEMLAREMVQRGQLEIQWLTDFLHSADHPQPNFLVVALFPNRADADPSSASETALPGPATLPRFVVGPPITHPYQFFGRTRILHRLFNLWQRLPLQNAAIIGPKRSGKTSLLHYLQAITTTPATHLRANQKADWLPQPKQVRWIFVDFQDARLGTREGLMRYLLHTLDVTVPTPCGLDHFLDALSEGVSQPTIILLDEIGVALERYPELDDSFWESLRSLATNQVGGKLGFVLTAPAPPDQLAQQSNLGSPFFNIFGYTATLGPLSEMETLEFIDSSLRSVEGIVLPQTDLDWLQRESGGWPILLQALCREYYLAQVEGEPDDLWQAEGLAQIQPYRYLLD